MALLLLFLLSALGVAVALVVAALATAILLDLFHPQWGSLAEGRRERGLCFRCGYDLTGNVSGVCPECGTPTPQPPRK